MKKISTIFIVIFYLFSSLVSAFADNINFNKVLVKVFGDKIRVAFKYDFNNDMWIDFTKNGVNSLLGIGNIYLFKNNSGTVDRKLSGKATLLSGGYSDWLSPYIVKVNNNGDNGKIAFTGGHHGSDGNAGGNPTAMTLSFKVFVDNLEVKSNKESSGDRVNIEVVNLIQGYNTKTRESNREILKETIHYSICRNNVDVSVEMEALEDLTIIRYYGIQTLNSGWKGKVYYLNSGSIKGYNSSISSSSGAKKDFPNVRMLRIDSETGRNRLIAWIDGNYGLGNMEFLADNLPCAFTESYGKSYFGLIFGKEKVMKKGEKLYYKGGYAFYRY